MTIASTTTLDNGLVLSFAEHGDPSAAAVVFLPGPTDSWLSYQPVLDLLPTAIRAVAVSPRGHGDSTKPAAGYQVEDFAADVPAVLDALGIPEAVLVGHSGSCFVARRVAMDHPDRIVGLMLEASPCTLVGNDGLVQFIDDVVSGLDDPIDPELARSFVADTSSSELRPEVVDALVLEVLKVPAHVWREVFESLLHYDDLDRLASLVVPTLLIWGDADPIIDFESQEQLLRRVPSATLITYPGIGHTPRWEAPSRFAADVTTFVDEVRRR